MLVEKYKDSGPNFYTQMQINSKLSNTKQK